ncbi:wat1-related protein at1g70260 [Phtheirospermum japonicum]|uniref:WAT1-related protein n=1 Tax=Phtheirospermum japonicum TaxID=374723 RepID=A0A830B0G8_9LAMI|nr:wat1-related protein at1g70260 [Phtheirospermum japonicum]
MRENMGGGVKVVLGEVLPCAAMVVVEGCVIGLTIMASTAMARGMSPFVFVVYTNALGSFFLIPFSFFYHRADRSEGPLLTLPFLVRVFLLGLIGVTIAQNLAFVGLSYSSPIVACGMANQLPALTFILGIILRTTRFDWKSSGSRARLFGTFISLMGAISLTLYKGPTIRSHSSPSLSLRAGPPRLLVFTSTHENWALGCILFAASSLTLAIWNIVQVGTFKICPQVMKVVSFYSLFGTIQTSALAVFLERDLSAWRLDLNFELLIIVLTAIFSSVIRSSVQIWCTKMKGPYFVPIFKPFGIPYASTFGCLLFADTFHYGSMMGAFVCGVGYYTALWGQIKDEEIQKLDHISGMNSTVHDQKVPLLLEDSQV